MDSEFEGFELCSNTEPSGGEPVKRGEFVYRTAPDGDVIIGIGWGIFFQGIGIVVLGALLIVLLLLMPLFAEAQALGCYVGLDNPDSCMTKRGIECSTDSKYNERLHGAPVGNLCDVIAIRDKQIEEIAAALRHETRVKRRLLWYIRYLIDRGII